MQKKDRTEPHNGKIESRRDFTEAKVNLKCLDQILSNIDAKFNGKAMSWKITSKLLKNRINQ